MTHEPLLGVEGANVGTVQDKSGAKFPMLAGQG